jgi:hypothetical protein
MEALRLLGLQSRLYYDGLIDENIIRRTWKEKIKEAHPDKNTSENALMHSQLLNGAKDMLLARLETRDSKKKKKMQDAADETKARKEDEKKKFMMEEERLERLRKEEEEWNMQEEPPKKTMKSRAPGTRVHRNIEEYNEGAELVKKMKEFFAGNFEEKHGAHVLCSEILTRFIEFQGGDIPKLDKMLFLRHGKRHFKILWPNAKNAFSKRQRCYRDVCFKK